MSLLIVNETCDALLMYGLVLGPMSLWMRYKAPGSTPRIKDFDYNIVLGSFLSSYIFNLSAGKPMSRPGFQDHGSIRKSPHIVKAPLLNTKRPAIRVTETLEDCVE